jgi:hypothetical protein
MGILRSRARYIVLASALTTLATLPALALPGEAAAVIAHCGQPARDFQDVSPVTSQPERNLVYADTILRFQPMAADWSFLSAWRGHLPETRAALEKRMSCFGDALQQVAAAPKAIPDPTIAADKVPQPVPMTGFGIPFLWLIFILGAILIVFLARPYSRRTSTRTLPVIERRRPRVIGIPFRRRRTAPGSSTFPQMQR